MKLDPVCNISLKFKQDRDKIDKVIKYFMRPPSVITFPGRCKRRTVSGRSLIRQLSMTQSTGARERKWQGWQLPSQSFGGDGKPYTLPSQ